MLRSSLQAKLLRDLILAVCQNVATPCRPNPTILGQSCHPGQFALSTTAHSTTVWTHIHLARPPPFLTPTKGYNVKNPQYLYRNNGDESLYCIDLAGPHDFDVHGLIHGTRPATTQINPQNIQSAHSPVLTRSPSPHSPAHNPCSPSPMNIQVTQDLPVSPLHASPTHGQSTPQQNTQSPVPGSLPSLPAAE
jgi:hypothetical protein